MSPRDAKNAAFGLITPRFLQNVYHEHGREIANAESGARILMAPYLFATAALGIKGKIPAAVRGAKIVIDGHDGFVAEHDEEFETAEPTIFSAHGMTLEILKKSLHEPTVKEKTQGITNALHDTEGKSLDPQTDKYAQVADQLGCNAHGDLSWFYTGTNIARIGWIDGVIRPMYKSIGISSGGATQISQFKTVFQDGMLFLESAGVLDRFPKARKPLEVAGIAMTAYSAVDIMLANENNYLETVNIDPQDHSPIEKLAFSAGRGSLYLCGRDPRAVGPQSALHASAA